MIRNLNDNVPFGTKESIELAQMKFLSLTPNPLKGRKPDRRVSEGWYRKNIRDARS